MKKLLLLALLGISLVSTENILIKKVIAKEVIKKTLKEDLNKKLYNAISNNNADLVKELILKGVKVNQKRNLSYELKGVTPLIFASYYGYTEVANLLITNGADVNAKDNDGWIALLYTSREGYKELNELLIDNGSNINLKGNSKNNKGYTALMLASWNGHYDIVSSLISKGANVNIEEVIKSDKKEIKDIETELTISDESKLVPKSLEITPIENNNTNNKFTAIMLASWNGKNNIVDLLKKAGAKY